MNPTTFQEVVKSSEWENWMGATLDEMESLYRNSFWELVPKPKYRNVIGYKWVFRKKERIHEKEPTKFKARLVAKGYLQKEGVDYDKIFSPIVKHTSIRLLLSIVAQRDMKVEQVNVKTPLLHGDLEERHLHKSTSRMFPSPTSGCLRIPCGNQATLSSKIRNE
ncbi:unnamed protein product [Prunus armeniaca]